MSRITDIAKTMKSWWNEDDDPYVHRALDEIIRIDQEQAPTIEPKRGEWKIEVAETIYGKAYLLTCSECGETVSVTETALPYEHFCRNCGARMKGADDEASD